MRFAFVELKIASTALNQCTDSQKGGPGTQATRDVAQQLGERMGLQPALVVEAIQLCDVWRCVRHSLANWQADQLPGATLDQYSLEKSAVSPRLGDRNTHRLQGAMLNQGELRTLGAVDGPADTIQSWNRKSRLAEP